VFRSLRGKKGTPNELFDLNRIEPMPSSIRRLRKLEEMEAIQAASISPEKLQKYQVRRKVAESRAWLDTGFDSALEWAENYWGARWNVFDITFIEARQKDEEPRLFFSSDARPIFPVIRKISLRFTNVMLELTFADEAGLFLGVAHYAAGRGLSKSCEWDSDYGEELRTRVWERQQEDVLEAVGHIN
jgi:hypothetical protein